MRTSWCGQVARPKDRTRSAAARVSGAWPVGAADGEGDRAGARVAIAGQGFGQGFAGEVGAGFIEHDQRPARQALAQVGALALHTQGRRVVAALGDLDHAQRPRQTPGIAGEQLFRGAVAQLADGDQAEAHRSTGLPVAAPAPGVTDSRAGLPGTALAGHFQRHRFIPFA